MASYARGRNELRAGALALFAAVTFGVMFLLLTDRGLSRHRALVYVTLPTAETLRKGDKVVYRGVPVGQVRAIGFAPSGGVVVRARLNQKIPLTADATAALVAVGVFGGQAIELHPGSPGARPLASRDTVAGRLGESLVSRVEALGTQAERLLADTTVLLLQGALAAIGEAATGLRQLTGSATHLVDEHATTVGAAAAHAVAVGANLERATAGDELERALEHLEAATSRLVRTGENLETATAALASVLGKIDGGEGTLGQLINDTALYERLFVAAGTLDGLMADVKANPRRYISLKVF